MSDYLSTRHSLGSAPPKSGQGSGWPGRTMEDPASEEEDDDLLLQLMTKASGFDKSGQATKQSADVRAVSEAPTPKFPMYNRFGQMKIIQPNKKYYKDILSFGAEHGFFPPNSNPHSGSIMGGKHAKNKKTGNGPHSRGQAVDFRSKNHTDEEINYFIQRALAMGYSVEDCRDDTDKEGGRHIHIQTTPFPGNKRFIFSPKGSTRRRAGIYVPPQEGWMNPVPKPRSR